ncbi:MAG: hypothetical protein EA001_04125 [Oscillatoriales cyanobacterium]|nr:MAG: hypothetical protein EA001_04125 [Oscillatoriales cyanobacterium]
MLPLLIYSLIYWLTVSVVANSLGCGMKLKTNQIYIDLVEFRKAQPNRLAKLNYWLEIIGLKFKNQKLNQQVGLKSEI